MTNEQKRQFINEMRSAFALVTAGVDKFSALTKRQVVMSELADEDFDGSNQGITLEQFNAAIGSLGAILTDMTTEQAQSIYRLV